MEPNPFDDDRPLARQPNARPHTRGLGVIALVVLALALLVWGDTHFQGDGEGAKLANRFLTIAVTACAAFFGLRWFRKRGP